MGEVLVGKKNGAGKTERGQEMHMIYNRGVYDKMTKNELNAPCLPIATSYKTVHFYNWNIFLHFCLLFLFYISEYLPVCMKVHRMCTVPMETREGYQIPWNLS